MTTYIIYNDSPMDAMERAKQFAAEADKSASVWQKQASSCIYLNTVADWDKVREYMADVSFMVSVAANIASDEVPDPCLA